MAVAAEDAAKSNSESRSAAVFDYVVVGSGPSCAGLIWGLLQQRLDVSSDEKEQQQHHKTPAGSHSVPSGTTATCADPRRGHLRIAVVERGERSSHSSVPVSKQSGERGLSLSDWFSVSHDPFHPNTDLHVGTVNLSKKTVEDARKESVAADGRDDGSDASGLWRRIVDVPVGRGFGGTSLINAGLCQLPHPHDFDSWPIPYRNHLMDSCQRVRRQLIRNGCLVCAGADPQRVIDESDINSDDDDQRHSSPSLFVLARPQDDGDGESRRFKSQGIRRRRPLAFRRCTYWEGLLRLREDDHLDRNFDHQQPNDQIRIINELEPHVELIQGNVERLLFADHRGSNRTTDCGNKDNTVIGVEYSTVGTDASSLVVSYRSLYATRDVILCAGALETPALLLVSGVGGGEQRNTRSSNLGRTLSFESDGSANEVEGCSGSSDGKQPSGSANSNRPMPLGSAGPAALAALPVGEGLKDHVTLSRAVVLLPGRRPSTAPVSVAPVAPVISTVPSSTVNGVVSLRNVRLTEDDGSGSSTHHQFQVGVIEGISYDSILPAIVPGWCRQERFSPSCSSALHKHQHGCDLRRHALCWLVQRGLELAYWASKILLLVLVGSRWSPVYWLLRRYVVTVSVFLMNPTSSGSVRIKHRADRTGIWPSNPQEEAATNGFNQQESKGMDPPSLRRRDVELDLRLGYLDAPEDVCALRQGWIASQVDQESALGVSGVEVFPGFLVRRFFRPSHLSHRWSLSSSLDWGRFETFARATCLPYFHWCGSCRMMTNPGDDHGVVTPDLQVRGCQGLRICDASVFPTTVSAPTALTCAALGHLLGSRILPGYDNHADSPT